MTIPMGIGRALIVVALFVVSAASIHAIGFVAAHESAHPSPGPVVFPIVAEEPSEPFSPTSHIESPALLRATTNPAVHGKILVDGVARDEWGLAWMKISPGPHDVTFGDVYGLGPAPAVHIDAVSGATSEAVGNYARWGSLRVTTDPAVASTISVDGVPQNDWGMWRSIAPGTHTISFGAVAGFDPPADVTVTIAEGEFRHVPGVFTANPNALGPDPSTYGFLQVTTNPAVHSLISVNGAPRDEWGMYVKLTPGDYTVTFKAVYGFTPPAPRLVTVAAGGGTTFYQGDFLQHGSLRITTNPAMAATVFVDGVPRDDWGMWQSMEPGTYTVSFEPVPGFTTPAPQTVDVRTGDLTAVEGVYRLPTQSVSLSPTKDNTLCESATGSLSNGKGQYFFVGRTLSGSKRRAVIAFDVAAAIPAGATITSVRLTLSMSRTVADLEPVSLHGVLANWGEGSSDATANEGGCATSTTGDATWIHRFYNTERWTTAGGDFVATASASIVVGNEGSYTWGPTPELVGDVQRWLDQPGNNFGWVLIGNEAAIQTTKRFDSKDHVMASARPLLTVEFAAPSETLPLSDPSGGIVVASLPTIGPATAAPLASVRNDAAFERRR
jgi:hypothetical protein